MSPEERARLVIDEKLMQAGWVIQDLNALNLAAGLGVAVREFPTSTGPVDYALFVDKRPVGVVEAKRSDAGEHITDVETQSARYAGSTFKRIPGDYRIRFAYEATDKLIRFTDYDDIKFRARTVYSFFRPETLRDLLRQPDTVRNNLKRFPAFDPTGFRKCQEIAIQNLDKSFSENRPRVLVQMATGAGKTFTAITSAYRLLIFGKMKRILFLVDTRGLGSQAEQEFMKYKPNDDPRSFAEIYGVRRLNSSYIPSDVQVCISTIQRMYSILKGEELDEGAEETPLAELPGVERRGPMPVAYNAKYPPEYFDCIIVDECHRSIYNVWSQVFDYFDAFVIGLTATPDVRTFAFFNENVASEYSREQAIIDGVNVGEDIFLIETQVTKSGAHILKQQVETRNRLSREKRWKQLDEDVDYKPTDLDRDIVNLSQIRTVIRTFRECLFTQLFPRRSEVPKTLIFAKSDSHADDIVNTVREEFGQGNDFCRKITYRPEIDENGTPIAPETMLNAFRNSYNPRVAVTVDMIATGTDVKAIECLIFMRDVRSKNYFEQMKGRGTRTLGADDLKKVTPSATGNKDHFVIIDAVGVTKSKKLEVTRTLERKPSVPLKELMLSVALGARDEDTLTSLANRLIRLNSQLDNGERKAFEETVGLPANRIAANLLDAFDDDAILARARADTGAAEPDDAALDMAQKALVEEAVRPFHDPQARDYIENVRRSHEQIIDNVNLDAVTFAGFDAAQEQNAEHVIRTFRAFIEQNRDEIIALRILYDQRYADRPMAIEQLNRLYERLKARNVTVERLWDCYAILRPDRVKRGAMARLTDLISMIRFEMGAAAQLTPFADRVDSNFKQWVFRRNAGSVHFTEAQMDWLRLIEDHIAASLSVTPDDLDLNPFDRRGGLGRFYEVFGDGYMDVLAEMNEVLVG